MLSFDQAIAKFANGVSAVSDRGRQRRVVRAARHVSRNGRVSSAMKRRLYVWLLFCAFAAAIFILDTGTGDDISISVLYVTLVLVVRRTGAVGDILIAGLACFFLTIASYGLTPGFNLAKPDKAGLINGMISLFAITSVTYLSIKVVRYETRLRKARDQVARTMRGVSISELATSVLHEIAQPLGAMIANLSAIKRWLNGSPIQILEARTATDAALCNALRADDVIKSLRRLGSASSSGTKVFDMVDLIKETIDIFDPEIKEYRIEIHMDFSQKVISVDGDRSLLQQVLINLISNAIEAMDDDQIVDRALIVDARVNEKIVSVSVRDTGLGICPEALDNVFEPFYTTKPKGLGIGLAISRSIATVHGGSVQVFRNMPRGTVMVVTLPNSIENSFGRHTRYTTNSKPSDQPAEVRAGGAE
jgi:signal transduction histidine kinase